MMYNAYKAERMAEERCRANRLEGQITIEDIIKT